MQGLRQSRLSTTNHKSHTIGHKVSICILAKVDANIGTHVELASCLRLSVPTLNLTVKSHKETERSFVECGPFSKQQKTLKCLSLEKLESALAAWFKQACESNASIGGTHLKGKGFYISPYLEIANFSVFND
jgi:hypothetical protein